MQRLLIQAAEMLEQNAHELHASHTIPGAPGDWMGENDARARYAEEMSVAIRLRGIAAAVSAPAKTSE